MGGIYCRYFWFRDEMTVSRCFTLDTLLTWTSEEFDDLHYHHIDAVTIDVLQGQNLGVSAGREK